MISIPAPFMWENPPPPPAFLPSSLFQQIKSGHQIKACLKPAGLRIICLSENLHLTIWKSATTPP